MRNYLILGVVLTSLIFATAQAPSWQFWKYGNYGWREYASGQEATGHFPTDFSASPIDSLDELFMKHDQGYWAAKEMGGENGDRFYREADEELLAGLSYLSEIGMENWPQPPEDTFRARNYMNAAYEFFRDKLLFTR